MKRLLVVLGPLMIGALLVPGRIEAGGMTLSTDLPIAHGRTPRVEIQVDGLACPFCAFGIEKNLKKVPGVASVRSDIKDGKAIVELKPGTAPDPVAFAKAVNRAGFTPKGIRGTLGGTVWKGMLKLPGGGSLSLAGKIPADGDEVVLSGLLREEKGVVILEIESVEK